MSAGLIRRLFRPEIFQGDLNSKQYFEGWYFKQVTGDNASTLSIIPGISLSKTKRQAFIQVLDGGTGQSMYFEYNIKQFYSSSNRFEARIHTNVFSTQDITLNIWQGTDRVQGAIKFNGITPFPVTLKSPGIMGWYAYVPFMECYHGVVSLMHTLEGTIDINGRRYDFNGGRGYIEKDWGRSFPESWIWLQSNHFENPSVSFMFSLAKIPWMSGHFNGFLGYLSVNGTLYRFATYTHAKIVSLSHEEGCVQLTVVDRNTRLEISAQASRQGHLMAPVLGDMDRHIKECVDAEIHLKLTDTGGRVLFEGNGVRGGLEVQGDVETLR